MEQQWRLNNWTDPHHKSRQLLSSWKTLLMEHDRHTLALNKKNSADNHSEDKSTDLIESHRCRQVIPFPQRLRPDPTDLISQHTTGCSGHGFKSALESEHDQENLPAGIVSAEIIRGWKQKRRKINHAGIIDVRSPLTTTDETQSATTVTGLPDHRTLQSSGYGAVEKSTTLAVSLVDAGGVDTEGNDAATADLEDAIASLRSKLETLQPVGARPSDIAVATALSASEGNIDMSDQRRGEAQVLDGPDDDEVMLSQVATSQRSILIWDEIRILVEAMAGSKTKLQLRATAAATELGIGNLEDAVLHRLCANEIFVQDTTFDASLGNQSATEASMFPNDTPTILPSRHSPGISYHHSLCLYRLLFCEKALHLKSVPSRLFLDALLQASKAQGRAMVDSVLLPVVRDYKSYSKLTSDLVQKVVKEQTSATVIHFLSHLFDPVNASNALEESSALDELPVIFLSEIHLATVQNILSNSNTPCPLPTRLWTRFNEILETLWGQIFSVLSSRTMSSSLSSTLLPTLAGTLKEALGPQNARSWLLRLYCSKGVLETLSNAEGDVSSWKEGIHNQEELRLSNAKLVQVLTIWTMRQGPTCPDIENLQRLREFCAKRVDTKLGKGVVTKLDMLVKKKVHFEK